MKAAQITQYNRHIHIAVNDVPVPRIGDNEILIRVKAAAVNPVDILNLTGAIRLIQDYNMPLTLGNECAGIVEKVGRHVIQFQPGNRVYSRLPIDRLGNYVIDALGEKEFAHELSVLKENGILLSLRALPNRAFAKKNGFSLSKRMLFTLAGARYDLAARRQAKTYRFLFVRADGAQLEKITHIVEAKHIVPRIDPRKFEISQINDAVKTVAGGYTNGKIIVRFPQFFYFKRITST